MGPEPRAALAHLLLVSTPRPLVFFRWIVGLATRVVVLYPFRPAAPLSRLGDLSRPFVPAAGEDGVELVAGADGELGEDLVQVVLHGARAHEQPGRDLGVRQAIAGQPGDLGLPGGEPTGGIGGALAGSLARGEQFPRGSFGAPRGAPR